MEEKSIGKQVLDTALVLAALIGIAMITIGITGIMFLVLRGMGWLTWGWPALLLPVVVEFCLFWLYKMSCRGTAQ